MKLKQSENLIEKQIVGFMQSNRWRAHRNQVGVFQRAGSPARVTVGTVGFPDWTFIRGSKHGATTVDLMHVEVKAPGKKPAPKQFEVLASLKYLGELAVWADSLDNFKEIYFQHFPGEFNG